MKRAPLTVLLLFLACHATPENEARRLDRGGPPPTENWLEQGAEKVQKKRRKAWFEEMHRSAPDTDWRALERENGRRLVRQRNTLSALGAARTERWTERGSDNLAGRMHVAVEGPGGTSLYAGSSKGGVWVGGLDGTDWSPIGDNLYGGAHWLAVVPGLAGDVVLAATDGGEIHVSTNGGTTWEVPAGLPQQVSGVRRVLTSSDGADTLYVLLRRNSGKYQLYRSSDLGASFTKQYDMGTFAGDAWTPRTGSGDVYLIDGSSTMRSADGGDTWTALGALPAGAGEGELAGSEAGAPRLWTTLVRNGGTELHRSDNAGVSWSYVTNVSDYWSTLVASIVDADLFAYGGVEVHRTTNGGDDFSIVNNWWEYYDQEATKLHADIPGLDVAPSGPNSTDGGLYRSLDGLASVENLSLDGLRVSQYYSTLTSSSQPDLVLAGAQDQGYQRADTPPGAGTTIGFDQLISGDYGHMTSADGTHESVFSTYPGFILAQKGEDDPELYQLDFPSGVNSAWLPPVVADPYDRRNFFWCGSQLYFYERFLGNQWSHSLWSTHDFELSGGEYVSALCFSPLDPELAFVVTNHGRLYDSDDHGLTWTQSASLGPTGQYFYGTALVASGVDVDTVYVAGSGYGTTAVFRSTDGGASYHPWDEGLPDTLVYSIAEAPDGSGTLFAGTETGVWRRFANGGLWMDVSGNEAPITTYWSVEPLAHLNEMRFATYGRGIWDIAVEHCGYEVYGLIEFGSHSLTLDSTSATSLGTLHELEVGGGFPNSPGFLLVGGRELQTFLPSLAGFLLVDPVGLFGIPIQVGATGSLQVAIPLPSDPVLAGLDVRFQALLASPISPLGWAFSNGLAGRLCQ